MRLTQRLRLAVPRRALACALIAFSWAGACHGAIPGAGDALRDIQEKPVASPPPTGVAPIEVSPQMRRQVKPIAGLKVDVKAFRFTGAKAVSVEALQRVVARYTGPDKTFDDLQAAAEAVSEYLQSEGYFVAQAYLPEQDLSEGVVEI